VPKPDEADDFKTVPNPYSLEVLTGARLEPALRDAAPESRFQFERQGYFCADSRDSAPGQLAFNRTVGRRDTWAKIGKAG
jgi:glutaminyl-tRNA synthetase